MTLFKKLIRKETKKDRTIILDTSALNWSRSMEVIDEAEKVIILTGTIMEIDNLKTASGMFGNNLRAIARKCREDQKSEKFICVADYEKHSYQDKNIIEYCKKNKKTTILTSDNNLCNLAKAYKIEYIFIQAEEKPEQVKEDVSEVKEEVVVEEKEEVSQVAEVKEEVAVEEKEDKKTKKHIQFNENSIYVDSKKGFYAYNFLETAAGITEKLADFVEEDFLYEVLCSKKKQYMKIIKYKITKKDSLYDYEEVQEGEIYCINDIFRLRFSDEVNDELLKIFKENCT